MYSRQIEQLARQRHAGLATKTERPVPPCLRKHGRQKLRSNTGWAIVAIGLRIAESGSGQTSVAVASHWR